MPDLASGRAAAAVNSAEVSRGLPGVEHVDDDQVERPLSELPEDGPGVADPDPDPTGRPAWPGGAPGWLVQWQPPADQIDQGRVRIDGELR